MNDSLVQALQPAVSSSPVPVVITVSPVLGFALIGLLLALVVLFVVATNATRSLQEAVEAFGNHLANGAPPRSQAVPVLAPAPVLAHSGAVSGVGPELIAVLTAAAAATLGEDAANIRIQDVSTQGQGWREQGRSQLQTNHAPHNH